MVLLVPLAPVPNQTLSVRLGGQDARLYVYQRIGHLFTDVALNGILVIGGVLAHDRCWIVRNSYLGFGGDLAFVDQSGLDDPTYAGLGTRWLLFWYAPEEIPL